MKRFYGSVWSAIIVLAVSAPALPGTCVLAKCAYGASVNPVFAAATNNVAAQETVTASAVIVPSQVSELGFLISGIAKEIPIKEGDTVKAGQTLMVLDTPNLQYAVTEAEAALRVAQAEADFRSSEGIRQFVINYEKFTVKKRWVGVPHEVIDIANAGVQRAQAAVEIAQANVAQSTLIAPHAGTIAAIQVIPAEFVGADRAVVTLATLNDLQVETTDLSERDILNVHIGDAARISVEALNETFNGKVVGISPIADTSSGDVVFKVTIVPDEQPKALLWGMTATVEIDSGE